MLWIDNHCNEMIHLVSWARIPTCTHHDAGEEDHPGWRENATVSDRSSYIAIMMSGISRLSADAAILFSTTLRL
jgi:hypothetical protein